MHERLASRAALAAEIRRRGGVAAALETGLDADQMPDEELRETWRQLDHAHHAYTHAARRLEARLPELAHRPPARPTEPVNPEHLVGGYTIYRYTEPAGRRVETWTPCCGRPVRTNLDSGPDWAVCCACRIAYNLTLEGDVDGGWYAVFVVATGPLVIAKHRSPPPSALSPPPQPPHSPRSRGSTTP